MLSVRRRIERLERQVFGKELTDAAEIDGAIAFVEIMEQIRTLQLQLRSPERMQLRDKALFQARNDGWTLEEIAGALSMTRERVRAIVARGELLRRDRGDEQARTATADAPAAGGAAGSE